MRRVTNVAAPFCERSLRRSGGMLDMVFFIQFLMRFMSSRGVLV